MSFSSFAERRSNPQFLMETDLAGHSYNVLAGRFTTAADAVIGQAIEEPMSVSQKPGNDSDRWQATTWMLDGNILDGRLDFAVRTTVELYAGPADKLPDALTDTHHKSSKRWRQLAGKVGSAGLYGLGIEKCKIPLEPMGPKETTLEAANYAKFIATFSGGEGLRFKANPQEGQIETYQLLPNFDTVRDTASWQFLESHALRIMPEELRQSYAMAAAADQANPGLNHSNLTRYREESRSVPNARPRIHEVAQVLYAAGTDSTNGQLLAQLLEPDIAQVAALAVHDNNMYHIERSKDPDRTTLYHRLGWLREYAMPFQALVSNIIDEDVSGYREALDKQLGALWPIVSSMEALQAFLEPPHSIALDDWRFYPPQ